MTMKGKVLIALLATFVSLAHSSWFETCRVNGVGKYCQDDTTGWFECVGSFWFGVQLKQQKKCPPGTRCSCFVGNDCHNIRDEEGNAISDKDICQPMKFVDPMEEVVFMKFKRHGFKMLSPDVTEYYNQSGQILQDLRSKSLVKSWVDHDQNMKYYQLITPDEKGKFNKYSIKYPVEKSPGKCKKEKISKFEELGESIRYYQPKIESNARISVRYEKQVWENKVFHYPEEPGTIEQWTVVSDRLEKRIRPVQHYSSYVATQEDQCCDHDITVDYEKIPLGKDGDTDTWFQIPYSCL